MKVLLIDDEKELVSTLAERLALRGIEADWATSADEALKKMTDCPYDIAVVDIKMPKVGGLQLKKIIAERQPTIKFIFMTGHGSEEEFKKGCQEAGEEYYLIKPVDINILIKKMNQIVKK